jgi:hypothetical protein
VRALVSGEHPGITTERFSCVRRVGDIIRCSAEIETDYLDGQWPHDLAPAGDVQRRAHRLRGHHARQGASTTTGTQVRGSGRISVKDGVGQAVLRLTHG